MEQRISMITLGVADLSRARAFYEEGLGWSAGPGSDEKVVFYQLNGLALALYPRAALAEDAAVAEGPCAFSGITLAYNVRSSGEADQVMAQAEEAGAKVLKAAQKAFWGGYSGYFADPDGHVWEVAHNPFVELDGAGDLWLEVEAAE